MLHVYRHAWLVAISEVCNALYNPRLYQLYSLRKIDTFFWRGIQFFLQNLEMTLFILMSFGECCKMHVTDWQLIPLDIGIINFFPTILLRTIRKYSKYEPKMIHLFAYSFVKSPKNSSVHVIHLFLTFDWQTESCKCTCLWTVLNICTKAHFSWKQNVAFQGTYSNFFSYGNFFAPPNFHAWNLPSPQIETTTFVSKQNRNFLQRDTFKVVSFSLI